MVLKIEKPVNSTKKMVDLDASRLRFDRGQFRVVRPDALNENTPTKLFGLPLTNATLVGVARAIVSRAVKDEHSIIQFINAHCVNTLRTSPEYGRALAIAEALLPDGSGIALAAKLCGKSILSNLNGTDLFPELCEQAARQHQSMFFLGGGYGVAATASMKMRDQIKELQVAGTHHGFFGADEEAELIETINHSGATILMVGMGVPHQEIWIARNRARISVPVIIGVGGLFDYFSGRIPRAPALLRSTGMEWTWRLAQEPSRLAKRYLIGNFLFVARAIAHAWEVRGYARRYSAATKRTLDLSIALTAMVLLGPLFAALCLLITLEDRGPVFFRQTRIGAQGKPFRMWKFRSMAVDAEARRKALLEHSERDGTCFKMKHDPRITRVGRWLRRLSLDELPQIFNVLRGEMSIVGPRPALPQEVLTYNDQSRQRLQGAPGLTCSWQVEGRANIPFEQQVELDIEYLQHRSIWRDLVLIVKTIPAVLTGRGAY